MSRSDLTLPGSSKKFGDFVAGEKGVTFAVQDGEDFPGSWDRMAQASRH